jgi:two-component system, chemotaxis family, CheB/CheR fusion protein
VTDEQQVETEVDDTDDPAFDNLLTFLHEERGFDFTGYKRASLARRVQRRMATVGIATFEEYHDHLVLHQAEFAALFDTVLINVTSFFRDPESWDHLRTELLPDLVLRTDRPVRCWVAGCASGEEAYTLAIALAEILGLDGVRERVKIYATDVDEDALAHARAASYSAKDMEAVPPELCERYFDQVGGRFVVRKELRRSVIFGRNDLVKDAPISHVDVLTCRNTLMYFNAETQAQILNRLHFALRPEGYLFLGKAEMLLSHSSYFRPVELKRRFFRKITTAPRDRLTPRSSTAGFVRETAYDHAHLAQSALMSAAAAQLVLDIDGRLAVANNRAMHLCGLTQRDLGRPIQDLEVSYRPIELRAHIDEAVQTRRSTWLRDVEWARGGVEPMHLDIQFVPLVDDTGAAEGVTVIFNDVTQYRQLQNDLLYANRRLETAYEELQSTVEELETTNEELQSTVEELETTNEELQSTNEELETMNEELQAMNDELNTSNQALREHQDEVSRLNGFMVSILESMDSGVAVIDRDLRVLAWNHRAEDLWGVRTDEAVGVHLFNLDIGLPLEGLRDAVRDQLTDSSSSAESSIVDAVNRRGRALRVRVTLTPVQGRSDVDAAVMLMMDVVKPEE